MENFQGKRILITGAAGFIGSNLSDKLLELNAEVVGLDNFYNGKRENLEEASKSRNFTLYRGDIRDLNFLLDIMKDIDIVYHLAAFTSVPQSVQMPNLCNDVNVNGTLNILNAALKRDVQKVIFDTSSAVFGDLPGLPKKEDSRKNPISPYAVTKLAGECYMEVYHHVYGLDTTSIRYFNVFGPRQRDSPYSGVIAIWLGRIVQDQDLTIFGDGKQSRDFTYVKDVVKANILAALKKTPGETFNAGAGNPILLNDLASLMLKLTGKTHLKITHAEPRPGDILHSYADISKAKNVLNFEPEYDQEKGLRDYITWYKDEYKVELTIK